LAGALAAVFLVAAGFFAGAFAIWVKPFLLFYFNVSE
jgi:hypothetical protein